MKEIKGIHKTGKKVEYSKSDVRRKEVINSNPNSKSKNTFKLFIAPQNPVNLHVKKTIIHPRKPERIKIGEIVISPRNPERIIIEDKSEGKVNKSHGPIINPMNPMDMPIKAQDNMRQILKNVVKKSAPFFNNVKLTHLMLEITTRCNLHCKHCYCNADNKNYNHLPLGVIQSILKEFSENGGESLTLTGGEPKLHPDFWKIIREINRNHLSFNIFTNGTVWTKTELKIMRDLSLTSLQVSIDGLGKTHDDFRGKKGSFAKTINMLRLAKELNIPTVMMITIHEKNVNEISDLVKLARELDISGITMNTFIPQGRAKKLIPVNVEDLRNVFGNISFNTCTLKEESTACGVGFEKIAVLADGSIVPCEVMRDLKLGSIYNDNLIDVFYHSSVMDEIRKSVVNEIPECQACPVKAECLGGCKAYAWLTTGKFDQPDKRQCLIWREND